MSRARDMANGATHKAYATLASPAFTGTPDFSGITAFTHKADSISANAIPGIGLMPTQIFRLHTTFTDGDTPGDVDTITNWESADDIEPEAPFNPASSAVISDHTNGIFTFTSTGFYLVQALFKHWNPSSAVARTDNYTAIHGKRSNDNWYLLSKYQFELTTAQNSVQKGITTHLSTVIDVTSTSAHKIKFVVYGNGQTVHCMGNGDANESWATFSRLGDT
tara:strand:- start:144 stop:806 length:663 start_codon:yes stop_codon:yes gene_type:complete